MLFLVAGLALGRGGLGWMELDHRDEVVARFAELALFTILFVDGAALPLRELREAWRLPGRALLVGMPLTVGAVAVLARLLLGLTWLESFLVGAILSPTDPVFVSGILEHERVPKRVRQLLRVESGLNDGLALPVVMVLLAVLHRDAAHPGHALLEAAGGVVVGCAVPALFVWLERLSVFGATRAYRALGGVGIAFVLAGGTRLVGANEFLAAFAGGVTLASIKPAFAEDFRTVGAPVAEAIKLATLLVLGLVTTLPFLLTTGVAGCVFALLTLVIVRPAALLLALLGGGLTKKEFLAAAWFGPKGFASLLYGMLLLRLGLERERVMFSAIALVIVVSIIAHSSTDVSVARLFAKEEARVADAGRGERSAR